MSIQYYRCKWFYLNIGKIGSIPSKDPGFWKIPLKVSCLGKYHRKAALLLPSTIAVNSTSTGVEKRIDRRRRDAPAQIDAMILTRWRAKWSSLENFQEWSTNHCLLPWLVRGRTGQCSVHAAVGNPILAVAVDFTKDSRPCPIDSACLS
jgi:hypothetical protein